MAIITYEGFENYSSFNDVKSFVGLDNYQVATIINGSDGTVTPRNSGSCLKLTSSSSGGIEYYPKAMIQSPNGTGYNNGVVGFAWYAAKPASGSWGNFTPIAAFCDANGKPHFFVGINSSLQVQVRRWTTGLSNYSGVSGGAGAGNITSTTTSDYTWNTSATASYATAPIYHGTVYAYNYYISTNSATGFPSPASGGAIATIAGSSSPIDTTNKFILLGSTSSIVTENAWNYIEVKFVLDNTSTNGSIIVKLNRSKTDSTLDINATSIRNSTQANSLCSKVAFGVFWGHNSAATASAASLGWTTYIDDIYWIDNTSQINNDFIGRVSCKKFAYNTVANYSMTTPSSSTTGLSNVNEIFAGTGSLTTKDTANTLGATIDLQSSFISSETLTPINVRQYIYGYKSDSNSDIFLGCSYNSQDITVSAAGFGTDPNNGHLKFRDYTAAPGGNSWTNSVISNTTFKHITNNIS
jgi:hypothetical protein